MNKRPTSRARQGQHIHRLSHAAQSFTLTSLIFSLGCALIGGVSAGIAYAATGAPYRLMPHVITSPVTAGVSIGLGTAALVLAIALPLSSPIAARRLRLAQAHSRRQEVARSIRRHLSRSDEMQMEVFIHQQGPYGQAFTQRWSGVQDLMTYAAHLLNDEEKLPDHADSCVSTSRESVNAILTEQYESLWRIGPIVSGQPGWLNFWQAECAMFTRIAQHTTSPRIRQVCDCTALTDALLAGQIDPADALAALDDKARTLQTSKHNRAAALLRGLIDLNEAQETMSAHTWEQMWTSALRATPPPANTVSLAQAQTRAVHRVIADGTLALGLWPLIPLLIAYSWKKEMAHHKNTTAVALTLMGAAMTALVTGALSGLRIVYSPTMSVPLTTSLITVMVIALVASGIYGTMLVWLRHRQ